MNGQQKKKKRWEQRKPLTTLSATFFSSSLVSFGVWLFKAFNSTLASGLLSLSPSLNGLLMASEGDE